MKISKEWLEEKNACKKGIEWFESQDCDDPVELIKYFIEHKFHLDWGNWLIVRVMDYREYVSYAVYAAEQALPIWEKEFPDDKTPHEAIEAAKKCIDDPSKKNKAAAAADAAADAYAAADAGAAANASSCAIFATYAAVASSSASAASAATYAAVASSTAYAAAAAAHAAAAAEKITMQIKILKYGLQLLGGYNEK